MRVHRFGSLFRAAGFPVEGFRVCMWYPSSRSLRGFRVLAWDPHPEVFEAVIRPVARLVGQGRLGAATVATSTMTIAVVRTPIIPGVLRIIIIIRSASPSLSSSPWPYSHQYLHDLTCIFILIVRLGIVLAAVVTSKIQTTITQTILVTIIVATTMLLLPI